MEPDQPLPEKEIPPEDESELSSFENLSEQFSAEKNEEASDAFDSLFAELGIGATNAVEAEPAKETFDEGFAAGCEQEGESDYHERLDFSEHES